MLIKRIFIESDKNYGERKLKRKGWKCHIFYSVEEELFFVALQVGLHQSPHLMLCLVHNDSLHFSYFLAQICRIHMPLKDKFKTFYSFITGNNSFKHYTCTCIWFLVNLLLSVVYWLKHWMFKCLLIKDLIVTELDGFFYS